MWNVYILQSAKDGRYYVGCTSNLGRRLREHNHGRNFSTRNRRPFVLVYTEEYANQQAAFDREKVIKSYKGGLAFKRLLNQSVGGGVVNRNRL